MSIESNKNLNKIFNLPAPLVKELTVVETDENSGDDELLDTDFITARNNIHHAIIQSKSILNEITEIATAGEDPKAYAVAAQIIKTFVDANMTLLHIHKQTRELKPKKANFERSLPTTVNNTVYVGTTKDLQEMLKNKNKIIDQ